ncbi:MAG TPA: alpha-amylase family protein [Vicinamibacteria bacterium]|nr:alpha-amylase family protein [Vicinamibacteria bacterium]
MRMTRAGLGATAVAATVSLWAMASIAAAPKAAPPPRTRNDIRYSTEVVTPHVPWATQLPGGPIKGFFIPTVAHGRDMVELMQRLALLPTTVTIDPNWDVNCWGLGDFYGHEERGDRDDFRTVYGYVEEEITSGKPFEVIVLPGLNGWSRLTRPSRDAILRRVSEGAGLVLVHPFVGDVEGHPFLGDEKAGDRRIWEVSPLVGVADDRVNERGYPEPNRDAIAQGRWEVAKSHFITDGFDLSLIPSGASGGRFYTYQPKGEVLVQAAGHPVVAVRSYGKGRVVGLAWVGEGFVPEPVDPVETRTTWSYWEYENALLARAVLWAAGRESEVRLVSFAATTRGASVVLAAKAAKAVELEMRTTSAFGGPAQVARLRRELAAGESRLEIPASEMTPPWGFAGGRQIVDLVVREAGGGASLAFGAASFEVPREASVTGVRTNAEVYRGGETMSVVTQAAGALDSLRMRVRMLDDLDRTVFVEEKTTHGERAFFYPLEDFVGRRVQVIAELVDAKGRVVDQLRHPPLPVVAAERRQKEYRGLLSFETPVHHQAALRLRRLQEQAMTSGFTWGGKVNDELGVPRGYFGVYWYDRGPTTPEAMEKAIAEFQKTQDFDALAYLTKKELFKRTGDTRFLVRRPCLDDPETLRILADVSRSSARAKAVYNMDYYFVGDEGSLGSYADPVDFCFGRHTLASFRQWLRGQYDSLAELNRAWKSDFAEWDAVVPLTTDEARRTGRFAPWADHRTYMETSFAHAYATVRQAVVEGDPQGRIALSGTQVTTPWNGCDWHRLDAIVDDFLSYSGGNQWEIHRSFAKQGARVGFWTGYGRSGAAVKHEAWSAALSGVLYPNLFWSPSIVNPDLTFSRSGQDLGDAFRALRFEGIGRLLMEAERVSDGIAIHYSMPSVHAAGILGQHLRNEEEDAPVPGKRDFPAARDGWVKVLEDLGYAPDFVASEQVAANGLAGRRVFVLPYSLALSDAEVAAIRAFVEKGGVVIAAGPAGILDPHASWRTAGALDEMFGIGAGPAEARARAVERTAGAVSVTTAAAAWGLRAEALPGLVALEPALTATSGQALLRIGGASALVVRRVGQGWAVYLNQLLDGYPDLRRKTGGEAYRLLLERVLDHLGVRPAVSVTDASGRPLRRALVSRYRLGEADVVAVLDGELEAGTRYGVDGVTRYTATAPDSAGRAVRVRLPKAGLVVNARTGESFGRTDTVSARLVPGEALVLAITPEAGEVTLAGPASAAPGSHPAFTLRAAHLVRVHVFGPDGRFLPEYAANLVPRDGRARFVVPSAVDDPPGVYRIAATDVLTGARAQAALELVATQSQ